MTKIYISSDHAGFNLKEYIKNYLLKKNIKAIDLGPNNNKKTDYPIFAHKLANKVKLNKNNRGILVCRAAQCFSIKSTKLSRLHNDSNVITLGSRLINRKKACSFIKVFLNTEFEGGRHSKRLRRI